MKIFIFSVSIILGIILLTVTSGMHVKGLTDKLLMLEKSFPEKAEGESSSPSAFTESEELLNSSYEFLTSISNSKSINNVKSALKHLISCYDHGTYADYMAGRESYVEALMSLRRAEIPSLKGII